MARRKKQEVKVNNSDSLEGLMQEAYNDACLQLMDAQKSINELVLPSETEDIDDLTKIAKEKANLLKVKDSAIRIKLELAKLQSDILKNNGDTSKVIEDRAGSSDMKKDFESIREMFKKNKNNQEEGDE